MNKLWQPTNNTLYSNVFSVRPGYCAVLFAVGLLEEKVRQSAAEFTVPQAICVRRLVYDFERLKLTRCTSCCDDIYDIDAATAKTVGDECVAVSGCNWVLTPSNNLAVIGIPGAYKLQLNDATAIGEAQVYAEWYPNDAIPPHVANVFFA